MIDWDAARLTTIRGVPAALAGEPFEPPRRLVLSADASPAAVRRLAATGFFEHLEALVLADGARGVSASALLDAAPDLRELTFGAVEDPELIAHTGVERIVWRGGSLSAALTSPVMHTCSALRIGAASRRDEVALQALTPRLTTLELAWEDDAGSLLRAMDGGLAALRCLRLQAEVDAATLDTLLGRTGAALDTLQLQFAGRNGALPPDLGHCTALRALTLGGFGWTEGVSGTLADLERLTLRTIDHLAPAAALVRRHAAHLTHLDLEFRASDRPAFDALVGDCAQLKALSLEGGRLQPTTLRSLGPLSALALNDMAINAMAFWGWMANNSNLTTLNLSRSPADDEIPDGLPMSLRRLSLAGSRPDPTWLALLIEQLAPTAIEGLHLEDCDLSEVAAIGAHGLTALRLMDVEGFEPARLHGVEAKLADLTLTTRHEPTERAVEAFGAWLTEREWPNLTRLHAPDWACFDQIEGWLARGGAPRLDDLGCHAEDAATLARHLADDAQPRLSHLRVAGAPLAGLDARQPRRWPRTVVTRP